MRIDAQPGAHADVSGRLSSEPRSLTLIGNAVRLEPMDMRHAEGLLTAGQHASLWTVTVTPILDTPDAVAAYVNRAMTEREAGQEVPFVILHQPSDTVIGATRWMDIAWNHRRLEIGGTWITPAHQRTVANTEAKYLQLRHLFEQCGAMRVQFKTDLRNTASQRGLEGIGARREGVFCRHMIARDGVIRDSVYYGITDQDWPLVKARLEQRMVPRVSQ